MPTKVTYLISSVEEESWWHNEEKRIQFKNQIIIKHLKTLRPYTKPEPNYNTDYNTSTKICFRDRIDFFFHLSIICIQFVWLRVSKIELTHSVFIISLEIWQMI